MLDDEDRVAHVHQFVQDVQQFVDILEVQAGGRLVEDVERVAGGATAEFLAQLDALRFAAGERGGGLAEADVAQADGVQRLHFGANARNVLEEVEGFFDGHVKGLGDGLAAELDFQGLAVVAAAFALLAWYVDIRQELHLDADDAVALAGFTASALDVEAEAPRFVTARLGFGQAGIEVADVGEDAYVRGRVAARRTSDGALVDVDHLVEELDALDGFVLTGPVFGAVHELGEFLVEHLDDQGRLAAAADARHGDELAQGDTHVGFLEVIFGRAADLQVVAVALAAFGRDLDAPLAAQIAGCEAVGAAQELVPRRGADDLAAMLARARPHVHNPVGGADGVLVVFDDEDRVAQVAHAHQRLDEAGVVALVQADARLVEDVEHAHELAADLGSQPDALGFTAGERSRGAAEREIVQPDVDHELETGRDLFEHLVRDGPLARGQGRSLQIAAWRSTIGRRLHPPVERRDIGGG